MNKKNKFFYAFFYVSVLDAFIFLGIMAASTLLSALLWNKMSGDYNVTLIYVLAVLIISRLTKGFVFGIIASFISVLFVNFAFTYPIFALNFSITGYPIMFVTMLAVSIITSTMTSQIKLQEKARADAERETTRANLLRAVSHDLRTPLTSILGTISALLENENTFSVDSRNQLLADAKGEAEWLIRMVENLLSVTKMGTEANIKKTLEASEEVIAESLGKVEKRLAGITVEVSVPDALLMVPMDAMLIEQVIMNLLENVAAHAKGVTQVRLSVSTQGHYAVFSIEDNGCGIPKNELDHIFSGYLVKPALGAYPADQKRNMGIGLSACMSIINAHGGTMTAENLPAGGAAFRFTLPLDA